MASRSRSKSKGADKQEERVAEYVHDSAKLNRAIANSTTNKRQSPQARAMANGDKDALKRSVYNMLWNKVPPEQRARVAEKICKEWNYCDNRGNIAEIQSIVHILTGIVKPILIPVCVWVFVIQYRMLDSLCECEDRELPFKFKGWIVRDQGNKGKDRRKD